MSLERVTVVQQRETVLDIARRKDNDELIALLTNVKVWTVVATAAAMLGSRELKMVCGKVTEICIFCDYDNMIYVVVT